ncbi:MAG: DUF1622 domain-containing protein [Chloroflexota bacterium]
MLIGGSAWAAVQAVLAVRASDPGAYGGFRRDIGRSILLGLELLIVADIILTMTVDQTLASAATWGSSSSCGRSSASRWRWSWRGPAVAQASRRRTHPGRRRHRRRLGRRRHADEQAGPSGPEEDVNGHRHP